MNAADNKRLVQRIFDELGKGNSRPFVDSMADDFSWTIAGASKWSRKYEGKQAVIRDLFGVLRAALTPPIVTIGRRFIADGDYVAVEAQGRNTTKDGIPYNNTYCFVFRLAEGKLREVTEYMDTELVGAVLPDPDLNRSDASRTVTHK
jgi:uncharacterized protein